MRGLVRFWPAIAIAAVAYVVVGCGGGSTSAESGSTAAAPSTSVPGSSASPPASKPPPSPSAPARERLTTLAGAAFDYAAPALTSGAASATFAIRNRPAWAEFDAVTGALTGRPASGDVGRYENVTIERDGVVVAFDLEVVASATGVARLSWEPSSVRKDGMPFDDVSGYRVYYGRSPQQLTQALEIEDAGVREAEIADLTPGTWYFVATAVDSFGAESELSPMSSKTIG